MRCFTRALRRAELPLRMTEGFNPRPRISFPLPLGVGVAGVDEAMCFELHDWITPAEVQQRLTPHLPDGMSIRSTEAVVPGKADQVDWVRYRIRLSEREAAEAGPKAAAFLEAENWPVQRDRKERSKTIDIRPYVLALAVGDGQLQMQLRVTPSGTVRPSEVLQAVGIGEVLSEGKVLTRTQVTLKDTTR